MSTSPRGLEISSSATEPLISPLRFVSVRRIGTRSSVGSTILMMLHLLDAAADATRSHRTADPSRERGGKFSRLAAGHNHIDIFRFAKFWNSCRELLRRRIGEAERLGGRALAAFVVGDQFAQRPRGYFLDARAPAPWSICRAR